MQRGFKIAPKLASGDGALGFWKAVAKLWLETDQQRCWAHKTANILETTKNHATQGQRNLNIWQAETQEQADEAFDHCIERLSPKYPEAMKCLAKDKASRLAFNVYPAENWQHIRTTNPVESVFVTVRLRTTKTKNCGSRATTPAMAFKPMETAHKHWFRLRGYKLMGVKSFKLS